METMIPLGVLPTNMAMRTMTMTLGLVALITNTVRPGSSAISMASQGA